MMEKQGKEGYNEDMVKKDEYLARVADKLVRERLENFGAVNIDGCKWCGKTRTAKEFSRSFIELQNPENKDVISLIKSQPSLALKGEKPRLIDEWQDAPQIWDAIRYEVDNSGEVGRFLLTGSATPRKSRPRHSGAGRIASVKMRPMSLFESGDSNGAISLERLFKGETEVEGRSELKFEDLAFLCIRGGWPSNVVRKTTMPELLPKEYLGMIAEREDSFSELDYYSPGRMKALLRSLARNTATPMKMTTILKDVGENTGVSISDMTLGNYLAILEQVYLIEDIEAWSPKLRSKTEIRTTRKRFLVDPSLAVASLYASREDLIRDVRTFGLIFETLCLRDLKTYMEAIGGDVFYYRDKNGLEADAILHRANGDWGAVEIKLGADMETVETAAESLKNLKDKVDVERGKEPTFLMVLTGNGNFGYRREDGVFVVPIGCLKD